MVPDPPLSGGKLPPTALDSTAREDTAAQPLDNQTAGDESQLPQPARDAPDEHRISSGDDPTAAPTATNTSTETKRPTKFINSAGRNVSTPLPGHEDVEGLIRDDPLTWFAHQIGKPKEEDLTEMLRWTQKTLVEESVTEYQIRWITRAIPILAKLDKDKSLHRPAQTKRTFLLLVAADYLHKPRYKVFQLPGTGSQAAYHRWLKKPHIRAIYDELYGVMEEEVLEHELSEIRKSVRVTRISAARAAEVRAELLEHPNPWVALQSARDIMQSADRQTAAKGMENRSVNIHATLTAEQVEQLLERAGDELADFDTQYMDTTPDGRPLIISGDHDTNSTAPSRNGVVIVPEASDDE